MLCLARIGCDPGQNASAISHKPVAAATGKHGFAASFPPGANHSGNRMIFMRSGSPGCGAPGQDPPDSR
jgi:hypothetical protein